MFFALAVLFVILVLIWYLWNRVTGTAEDEEATPKDLKRAEARLKRATKVKNEASGVLKHLTTNDSFEIDDVKFSRVWDETPIDEKERQRASKKQTKKIKDLMSSVKPKDRDEKFEEDLLESLQERESIVHGYTSVDVQSEAQRLKRELAVGKIKDFASVRESLREIDDPKNRSLARSALNKIDREGAKSYLDSVRQVDISEELASLANSVNPENKDELFSEALDLNLEKEGLKHGYNFADVRSAMNNIGKDASGKPTISAWESMLQNEDGRSKAIEFSALSQLDPDTSEYVSDFITSNNNFSFSVSVGKPTESSDTEVDNKYDFWGETTSSSEFPELQELPDDQLVDGGMEEVD